MISSIPVPPKRKDAPKKDKGKTIGWQRKELRSRVVRAFPPLLRSRSRPPLPPPPETMHPTSVSRKKVSTAPVARSSSNVFPTEGARECFQSHALHIILLACGAQTPHLKIGWSLEAPSMCVGALAALPAVRRKYTRLGRKKQVGPVQVLPRLSLTCEAHGIDANRPLTPMQRCWCLGTRAIRVTFTLTGFRMGVSTDLWQPP